MNISRKIRTIGRVLLSLPATLYFNFRYLPLHQAIKLPVVLYRPRILGNGTYKIEGKIKTAQVRLGFPMVSVFREKGVVMENNGLIVFKGDVTLGGGVGVSVGKTGKLVFGDEFCNQTGMKIICYHSIMFGDRVRIGWHTIVSDTDFHALKSEDGTQYTKGYGPILVGDDVWISSYCKIYKNADIPEKCVVGASSMISKKIDCKPYSFIYSEHPLAVRTTGYWRDMHDDKIKYPSLEEQA